MQPDQVRRFVAEIDALWSGTVGSFTDEGLAKITTLAEEVTFESAIAVLPGLARRLRESGQWRPTVADIMLSLSDGAEPDTEVLSRRLPPPATKPSPPPAVSWEQFCETKFGETVDMVEAGRRLLEEVS